MSFAFYQRISTCLLQLIELNFDALWYACKTLTDQKTQTNQLMYIITYFWPICFSLPPENRKKNGFLLWSGSIDKGREREIVRG